ncbi:biotin-dependent carboxyltransferase family protein [Rathayibacter oskolensis]|uniref:5-oxoprolinase subunit C family protein n=1 Tax=Rathayibacter oskolensis TaxID=1891671 RepID=UPI000A1C8363|nr:biotin-dependent carboxyltransferase family protein [Rathayibacter oskolensis]
MLDPGPLALVEDEGRPGYASLGAGRSGAMDRGALRAANRLLGNEEGAAVLELLGAGFTARFEAAAWFSVSGGEGLATLDGRVLDRMLPTLAARGSVLRLGPMRSGVRRTVAVRGGFAVPSSLGSRSRDTLSALGPEPLKAGELISVGRPRHPLPVIDWWPFDAAGRDSVLAVHPGPRLDRLPAGTWQRLLEEPWRVGTDADRVGIRLCGTPLSIGDAGELPSEGLVHGSVQLPPSGLPVIFGPDHPVTGGYPVIAVVDSGALDLLAQLAPGADVRFRGARRAQDPGGSRRGA